MVSEPLQSSKNHSKHEMALKSFSTVATRSQTSVYSDYSFWGGVRTRTSDTTKDVICTIMTLWSQASFSKIISAKRSKVWMTLSSHRILQLKHSHNSLISRKTSTSHTCKLKINPWKATRTNRKWLRLQRNLVISHSRKIRLHVITVTKMQQLRMHWTTRPQTNHCIKVYSNISTSLQCLNNRQVAISMSLSTMEATKWCNQMLLKMSQTACS